MNRTTAGRRAQAKSIVGRALVAALAVAAPLLIGTAAAAQTAWYTAEQAERGARTYFANCAGCHGANQTAERFAEYPDAASFFNFISGSMPYDGDQLSMAKYTEIVAFVLSELGFPAGDTELTSDRAVLAQISASDAPAAP